MKPITTIFLALLLAVLLGQACDSGSNPVAKIRSSNGDSFAKFPDTLCARQMGNCSLKTYNNGNDAISTIVAKNWSKAYKEKFPAAPFSYAFDMDSIRYLFEDCDTCDCILMYFGIAPESSNAESTTLKRLVLFLTAGKDRHPHISNNGKSILGYNQYYTNHIPKDSFFNPDSLQQQISFPYTGWVDSLQFEAATLAWKKNQPLLSGVAEETYRCFSLDPVCFYQCDTAKYLRVYLSLQSSSDQPLAVFHPIIAGVKSISEIKSPIMAKIDGILCAEGSCCPPCSKWKCIPGDECYCNGNMCLCR